MTEPLKWALVDLLRLLNDAPWSLKPYAEPIHEKLEGIAATLGVDIHHSRPAAEDAGNPEILAAACLSMAAASEMNWRKQKRATRG